MKTITLKTMTLISCLLVLCMSQLNRKSNQYKVKGKGNELILTKECIVQFCGQGSGEFSSNGKIVKLCTQKEKFKGQKEHYHFHVNSRSKFKIDFKTVIKKTEITPESESYCTCSLTLNKCFNFNLQKGCSPNAEIKKEAALVIELCNL